MAATVYSTARSGTSIRHGKQSNRTLPCCRIPELLLVLLLMLLMLLLLLLLPVLHLLLLLERLGLLRLLWERADAIWSSLLNRL